jgi:Zn-dependent protease
MDLFGFRVGVDLSWFFILFLLIFLLSGPFRATLHSSDAVAYITTVVSVLLLFASLIVHELGHAFVARRQGIEVKRIDLFLFGGLTQMSRDAQSPGEDFKIAVAGPLHSGRDPGVPGRRCGDRGQPSARARGGAR